MTPKSIGPYLLVGEIDATRTNTSKLPDVFQELVIQALPLSRRAFRRVRSQRTRLALLELVWSY